MKMLNIKSIKIMLVLMLCVMTTGCISTVVGAVVDTTIAVVKIPFKVGAAVVDVVTEDDFTDVSKDNSDAAQQYSSDAAAVEMENAEF